MENLHPLVSNNLKKSKRKKKVPGQRGEQSIIEEERRHNRCWGDQCVYDLPQVPCVHEVGGREGGGKGDRKDERTNYQKGNEKW